MELSFLGHACFRLRGRDASVVIDPYGKSLGLPTQVPSRFAADVLLITHDHPGHNNAAMNRGVLQVARHFVHGNNLTQGMLNRVEAVIRTFDPCLSCSTHADGRLALEVELRSHEGEILDSCRTR